jgi:hypothetical protein
MWCIISEFHCKSAKSLLFFLTDHIREKKPLVTVVFSIEKVVQIVLSPVLVVVQYCKYRYCYCIMKYSIKKTLNPYTENQRHKEANAEQAVLLGSERMGPLRSTPSTVECFPLPVPRAGYAPSTLLLLDTQRRSYTIQVWSYETFIVIESVLDR